MATIEDDLVRMICDRSDRLEPRPPQKPERFVNLLHAPLPRPPRAILFDVYGTLLISASGDIGSSDPGRVPDLFAESILEATETRISESAARRIADRFRTEVERTHERMRDAGIPQPEIDVRRVWATLHEDLVAAGVRSPIDLTRLALAHELITNPVWPMPGVRAAIDNVRHAGLRTGIVSNAQFYTPLLFPALLGISLTDLGFDRELVVFSYERGRAKPDPALFESPLAELRAAGIDSEEVVYLGNDMLNDVAAARHNGMMTILFAGDARSLRVRDTHPEARDLLPDSVIESLGRLAGTLPRSGAQ